jgi:hypothetical protein
MSAALARMTDGKMTRQALLSLAVALARQKGIKLDRGAKRVKDALICWFCENCSEILGGAMQPAEAPPVVGASWMDQMEPSTIGTTLPEDAAWEMTDEDTA